MGTKQVRLDEDVYRRVKAHNREDETMSETIDRLMGDWSLLDLAGTYTEEEAAEALEAIEKTEEIGKEDTKELLEMQGIDVDDS